MHTLFFDGCSKGNPGKGGAGSVLYDNNQKEIDICKSYVGDSVTNNMAEYTGLIIGLEKAIQLGITDINVNGDSLLVIRQMKGEYKVNAPSLLSLYKKAKELSTLFRTISFGHVYRMDNKRADQLSNEALNI
jgi:ribonuclease HI